MKGRLIFKLGALFTILSVLLVVPALGQTAQTNEELGKQLKDYKAQTLKELQIAPDKEKALMAVEDKFSLLRGEIAEIEIAGIGMLLAHLIDCVKDCAHHFRGGVDPIIVPQGVSPEFRRKRDAVDELAVIGSADGSRYGECRITCEDKREQQK